MISLLVISNKQAKMLIAKGISNRLRDTKKRVYFAYGSTNQLILNQLGISVERYYNGYISSGELKSNRDKPNIVVLNSNQTDFADSISPNDIIIKGGNALVFENGKYRVAVAVASSTGGTYGNILLKASCVGAEVLIPISHEKLVPKLLANKYHQNSFELSMGLPIALFEINYGEIYTEIEAFRELFDLKAEIYISGGINDMVGSLTFVVEGSRENILKAQKEIKKINNDR